MVLLSLISLEREISISRSNQDLTLQPSVHIDPRPFSGTGSFKEELTMCTVSRLDYCQFLLSSHINYTMTYFADHVKRWSHDTINGSGIV